VIVVASDDLHNSCRFLAKNTTDFSLVARVLLIAARKAMSGVTGRR
jgi:hypothetical protein